MTRGRSAHLVSFLAEEARALLTRLDHVRLFSLTMPSVAAATVPIAARRAIERHLVGRRRELRQRVLAYIQWLVSASGRRVPSEDQQRRFTVLRLQFNATLDQLDIFADMLTQRTEH